MQNNTQAIRIQVDKTNENEHSTPMFLTSSFTFDTVAEMQTAFADASDDNIYSRYTNPNVKEFVDKMVALEGAEAGLATTTGMSAIFGTFMALLNAGDHFISCSSIFGNTHTIITKHLPRFNISYDYVSATADLATWQNAVKPNTKFVYIETPTNPGLEIIDLKLISAFCKKNNLLLIVDNCFATPYLQRPIELGADIVIHSATKWIDGQGRVLGGVIVGSEALVKEIFLFCRVSGPALSAFNAWLLSKSLETLEVRLERHCSNALAVANALASHKAIDKVIYPFLPSHPQYAIAKAQMSAGGGIVSFNLKGGLVAGIQFLDALQMISRTANLGDTRTIASHPASTTHAKLTEAERLNVNITSGLIRVSIGLENVQDILNDIVQALDKC